MAGIRLRAVRAEEAVGRVLAYDVTASTTGFKGPLLRRGKVVVREDVELLKDHGHYVVYVYDDHPPGTDEVHEEEAVAELGKALAAQNVRVELRGEGKAFLVSESRGMLLVKGEVLWEVNRQGVFVVGTRRTGSFVEEGVEVGFVDLVPLTVSRKLLDEIASLVRGREAIAVRPARPTSIALVVTGTEVYEGRKRDMAESVVRSKAEAYGATVERKVVVPDDLDAITKAVEEGLSACDCVVATGGMSVDPTDLTPKAIASVADEVVAYGLPLKPNTMTMVAYRGEKPIIGVPGGIVFFRDFNVLDVLLPWVVSRTRITRSFLLSLAEGGLTDYFISKVGG